MGQKESEIEAPKQEHPERSPKQDHQHISLKVRINFYMPLKRFRPYMNQKGMDCLQSLSCNLLKQINVVELYESITYGFPIRPKLRFSASNQHAIHNQCLNHLVSSLPH